MANRTKALGAAPVALDMPAPRVIGYLAENWAGLNDKTPAVIVNPDATPMDQLAWCWGEAASLSRLSSLAVAAGKDFDFGDFHDLFYMRLPALAGMLEYAIAHLARANAHVCTVTDGRG